MYLQSLGVAVWYNHIYAIMVFLIMQVLAEENFSVQLAEKIIK